MPTGKYWAARYGFVAGIHGLEEQKGEEAGIGRRKRFRRARRDRVGVKHYAWGALRRLKRRLPESDCCFNGGRRTKVDLRAGVGRFYDKR